MTVKGSQAVTVEFTTCNPTTGAAADATGTPTAVLTVDGVDNGASVTVTNKATGEYKASVTLPALAAGQVVAIVVSATVATIAGKAIVWQDTADTFIPSEVYARIGAPTGASVSADIAAVGGLATTIAADVAGLDGAAMVAAAPDVSGIPAATAALLHDFDPAADTVAHVTLVDTTTDLTNGGSGGGTAGPGADNVTLSLGSLAAGAEVWVSTDLAGAVVVASGVADDLGDVTFMLDAGTTYYRWAKKPGVNFTNPSTFVAVAD